MAIFTYPTLSIGPSAQTFSLVPNTQVHMSPLSGATQTIELPGARWAGQITYEMLEDADVRKLRAFLAQMRGRSNRFYIYDFSHQTPARNAAGGATALGTPLTGQAIIAGATSVLTNGWSINQIPVLTAGDYFSIVTGELKMVVTTVNSSATGTATIVFEPPARTSVAVNTTFSTSTAKSLVMLADDSQDQMDMRPPILGSITIKFMEAFS